MLLCAGGTCVLPDQCKCARRYTNFRDGRGRPSFRKPNGDPADTGYTGYDCNTPICTQAERFVLNRRPGTVYLAGDVSNEGVTFQAGCLVTSQ